MLVTAGVRFRPEVKAGTCITSRACFPEAARAFRTSASVVREVSGRLSRKTTGRKRSKLLKESSSLKLRITIFATRAAHQNAGQVHIAGFHGIEQVEGAVPIQAAHVEARHDAEVDHEAGAGALHQIDKLPFLNIGEADENNYSGPRLREEY